MIDTVTFYDSPLPSKADYIAIYDFSRDVDLVTRYVKSFSIAQARKYFRSHICIPEYRSFIDIPDVSRVQAVQR